MTTKPPATVPPPFAEPSRHDTAEMPVTKGEMRRSFRANEVFTFVVAAMTAIAAVFGAYKLLLSEAEAAGRRGAEVSDAKQDALKTRVETLEKRFDRFDTKMDLVLDAMRVPPSVRPPPLDGGR